MEYECPIMIICSFNKYIYGDVRRPEEEKKERGEKARKMEGGKKCHSTVLWKSIQGTD